VGTRVGAVVPCRNEERTIGRCLAALRSQEPPVGRILVIDNASDDASAGIAARWADQVVRIGSGTVAGLRNAGAGLLPDVDVLVFVDADCEVAPGWLAAALEGLREAAVVGSRMLAAPEAPWVARRWAAVEAAAAHGGSQVWSGHLAVDAALFRRVGGFDASLTSGEDADLSLRVRAAGGRVTQVPGMVTVHHGYPGDLPGFLRRERWHTAAAGWFTRMSRRSQLLVALGGLWTALGVLAAGLVAGSVVGSVVGSVAGGRWSPGAGSVAGWLVAGWLAGTVLAVPGLGALAGGDRERRLDPRRAVHAVQDGLLLGLWTAVRVNRLARPRRRVRAARPARVSDSGCPS
jgi:GT2 family glycosyltransferase